MTFTCTIKVVPASGKTHCQLDKAGVLKCYLKSQPERGKANEELIKRIAEALKMPLKMITIIRGTTERIKVVHVETTHTYEQLLAALDVQKQLKLY